MKKGKAPAGWPGGNPGPEKGQGGRDRNQEGAGKFDRDQEGQTEKPPPIILLAPLDQGP